MHICYADMYAWVISRIDYNEILPLNEMKLLIKKKLAYTIN